MTRSTRAATLVAVTCLCSAAFGATITMDVVPGDVGSPASFDTGWVDLVVEADGVAEFVVDFAPLGIAADASTDPFFYTAAFFWDTAAPGATLAAEGVGAQDGTFVNFADAGIDTAISSSSTSLSRAFSFPAFPFDVYSYTARIEGLNEGDTVRFQKIGVGGVVVPEPAALALASLAAGAFGLGRRR